MRISDWSSDVCSSDLAKAMVDEQMAADRRAGVDVDAGQEARKMIDEAREEEEPRLEQPVRDAVHADREQPRVEADLPQRPRRGTARLDRIAIGAQGIEHPWSPPPLPPSTESIYQKPLSHPPRL